MVGKDRSAKKWTGEIKENMQRFYGITLVNTISLAHFFSWNLTLVSNFYYSGQNS